VHHLCITSVDEGSTEPFYSDFQTSIDSLFWHSKNRHWKLFVKYKVIKFCVCFPTQPSFHSSYVRIKDTIFIFNSTRSMLNNIRKLELSCFGWITPSKFWYFNIQLTNLLLIKSLFILGYTFHCLFYPFLFTMFSLIKSIINFIPMILMLSLWLLERSVFINYGFC
jgi:hypothetical protein